MKGAAQVAHGCAAVAWRTGAAGVWAQAVVVAVVAAAVVVVGAVGVAVAVEGELVVWEEALAGLLERHVVAWVALGA